MTKTIMCKIREILPWKPKKSIFYSFQSIIGQGVPLPPFQKNCIAEFDELELAKKSCENVKILWKCTTFFFELILPLSPIFSVGSKEDRLFLVNLFMLLFMTFDFGLELPFNKLWKVWGGGWYGIPKVWFSKKLLFSSFLDGRFAF